MFRKYVIITLAAVFFLGTTSCTSNKATDDSATSDASVSDDGLETADATENNSDLDTADSSAVADIGDDSLAPDAAADQGDQALADNSQPAVAPDDLSEAPPPAAPEATPDAATPPSELAANDQTFSPDADASADSTPTPDTETAASEPPPPEPAVPEPAAMGSIDDSKPAQASLQKIKSQPYKQGKTLVNAIYIARKGDTPETISQKVFGTDGKVKELCHVNSYNCSRPTKVGDKFYYNSPQRPNDETVMKTFYEDAGIQPQTYTAQAGDDIRKVGKELLGDSRSWMEIWATNDVESKHGLDEGTQLKYWPNSDAPAAPALAQTEKMGEGAPPPDQEQAENTPPPPPVDQPPQVDASQAAAEHLPANDLPPVPDQAQNQNPQAAAPGTFEPPPPPPPPPPDNNMAAQQQNPDAGMPGAAGEGQDQTMALGVGAVLLLAAAALFISIRKKRQKRQIDFNTSTQTQIE